MANYSAYTNAVVGATSSGLAVTWNPGHYVKPVPSAQDSWYYAIHFPGVRTKLKSYFPRIATGTPGVKGIYFSVSWKSLEPSFDVYDFTYLDEVTAYARSFGFRYGINIQCNSQYINGDAFPQYLIDARSTYFSTRSPNGNDGNIRYWNATARARLNALLAAIGAHVKNDPKCEWVLGLGLELNIGTSYLSGTSTVDGANNYVNCRDGFGSTCQAWHAAAPNKMGGGLFNDFMDNSLETAQEYYAYCAANFIAYQNPNSVHHINDMGQYGLQGMNYNGQYPPNSPFIDYSRIMPVFAPGEDDNDYYYSGPYGPALGTPPYQSLETQWLDKSGPKTVSQILTGDASGVHGQRTWTMTSPHTRAFANCSHYIWVFNDGRAGDSSNQWSTDNSAEPTFIRSKINTMPSITVPTCFNSVGVITGG